MGKLGSIVRIYRIFDYEQSLFALKIEDSGKFDFQVQYETNAIFVGSNLFRHWRKKKKSLHSDHILMNSNTEKVKFRIYDHILPVDSFLDGIVEK